MSATSETSRQLIEASDILYEGIALVRAVYMAAASLQIRSDVDAIQYAAESAIARLNAAETMIHTAREGL